MRVGVAFIFIRADKILKESVVMVKDRAAFKIIAAMLAARGTLKIVACFLHHGKSKVCLQVHFASFDFPCLKN